MKSIELEVTAREHTGKAATKKVRRDDRVPATVYGLGEPKNVSVDYQAIKKALYTPETYIINLKGDAENHQAVIREAQYHPVTDNILHVDFLRVDNDNAVEVQLPIKLVGTSKGVLGGGKLVPLSRRLKVRGIVSELPDYVEVDITELELLGQVAPLADIGSPLSIGTFGSWRNKSFRLVGRIQLNYGEGPWNEWYAAFDDGTWGWVAEAQGRVYLSFGRDVPHQPRYPAAGPGPRIAVGNEQMVVTERRSAKFMSAEGELPFAVAPGTDFKYADCQGAGGAVGTIDYGDDDEPDAFFFGKESAYQELFDRSVLRDPNPTQAAAAVGLNCPNCGAGIELRSPDEAERVACASCGSVLDCTKGNELYLLQAAKQRGPAPLIPLGAQGRFQNKKYTVYGMMTRGVTYDGVTYAWSEYLLRGEPTGYRWLIESDGHWTFVEPVSAGAVVRVGMMGHPRYDKTTFRPFTSGSARVMSLMGEFYWKVSVGEQVEPKTSLRRHRFFRKKRPPTRSTGPSASICRRKRSTRLSAKTSTYRRRRAWRRTSLTRIADRSSR